jgi:hypothetical protein
MTRGVKLKFRKGSIVSMNKIEIELPIQYPEYKATNDFEVVIRIIKKRTPLRIKKDGHFNRKITATEVPRAMYLISKFENKIKKVK